MQWQSVPVTEASKGPIAWVTWLRIVAIYAVVMIHTAGSSAAAADSRQSVDGWVSRALDFSLMWAVPVFVMISGALALDPTRFRGTGDFLRKRLRRLVPAIVVWHMVYLAYFAATTGDWVGVQDTFSRAVTGQVAPHLYFFWIVLGLSVLTPVLVPWLAQVSRRAWVIAALLAWSVPILSMWPLLNDGSRLGVVESAWSWWVPYLGAYLMGWALRGVVLSRRAQLTAALAAVAMMGLLTWQWNNPEVPTWIPLWLGAHYYSPLVAALSVLVFLLAQATIRADGALSLLTQPRVLRWAAPVGEATMGIFALHFLILIIGTDTGILGTPETTWPMVLLRFVVVAVVTTVLVLVLRRVPYVRQVL